MQQRRRFLASAVTGLAATAVMAEESGCASDPNGSVKVAEATAPAAVGSAAGVGEADGPPNTPADLSGLYQKPPVQDALRLGGPAKAGLLGGTAVPLGWSDAKVRLRGELQSAALEAEDPIRTWAATFDRTFDQRSQEIVIKANDLLNKSGSPHELVYEPQLFDVWLRSASALLDRCLTYRREMGQFEVNGVSAALDYLNFLKTTPLMARLIHIANMAEAARVEQQAQTDASHKFSQAWGLDKVAKGEAFESHGAASVAAMAVEREEDRTATLLRQFYLNHETQLAKFTSCVTPGSASNWAERYLRLDALLNDDLADAWRKCYCASVGLVRVLGIQTASLNSNRSVAVALPRLDTLAKLQAWVSKLLPNDNRPVRRVDVVDALVLWTRAVVREIERQSQYENEVTISIPLSNVAGSLAASILSQTAVADAVSKAPTSPIVSLPFELTAQALPFGMTWKNLRMLGVGLTVVHSKYDVIPLTYLPGATGPGGGKPGTPASQADADTAFNWAEPRLARFNVVLKTPPQAAEGATYLRPPVLLPNVRIQGGASGDLEPLLNADPVCRGLNPFGNWEIRLDVREVPWFNTERAQEAIQAVITGFVLHLRVRGAAT